MPRRCRSACSVDPVLAQITQLASRILGLLDHIVDVPVPGGNSAASAAGLPEMVSGPVPQIPEDAVDVVRATPQVRASRSQELFVCVPVPQVTEEIVEVLPRPVPQVVEEIVKVPQPVPHERIQERVGEQILAIPCATDEGERRGSSSTSRASDHEGNHG